MKLLNFILLIIILSILNSSKANTWYLDEDDVLKNDEMPELSIYNKKGAFLFYINNKKLPISQTGTLVKITSSAPLIDSITTKDKICIQAVAGANSQEQNIKNIYIIHKNRIKAFQTNNSNINCESELK